MSLVTIPWAVLGASFATYVAALDPRLTSDGVVSLVVLGLGARGVLGGPVGFQCDDRHLGGRVPGSFVPRASLLGSAWSSCLARGAYHHTAR